MTDIVVVGAGFSGTLQAIHLLREGHARVTLIERGGEFGGGIAFSLQQHRNLLNVRSANMSAFPDEPDHFARWLARHGADDADGFTTRRSYRAYLRDILAEAERDHPGRLRRCAEAAVEVLPEGGRFHVSLAGGTRLAADKVVLALGNLPPLDPPGLAPKSFPRDLYVPDPWSADFTGDLSADDTVVIIGTGLTMVDVASRLAATGFEGEIRAISRRGLLPRSHEGSAVAALPASIPPAQATPLALLRHVRRRSDELGWRTAVDELRPITPTIWRRAPIPERRRFLRHLRPWWDVHRHRVAPSVAEGLARLIRDGRLTIAAGTPRRMEFDGDRARLAWRPRGGAEEQVIRARRVINCTGPQGDLTRTRESLLRLLLASGHIRPDVLGLGIDVDDQSRAVGATGRANPGLLVVGPMSRGAFWEIVAVPDLRLQARAVARALATGGAGA